jgi:hypothetical protein
MIAFFLSIGIFVYFLLLGLAFSTITGLGVRKVQRYLIAPSFGITLHLFATFITNRLGIPVGDSAPWVFGIGVLIILKQVKKLKEAITTLNATVFLGVVLSSTLITWPMFRFGFAWLSYANDDMTNYVLGAKRFYNSGFFDDPSFYQLNSGMDYSQAFYYFHAFEKTRPGSELMLSSISWIVGGNGLNIFMPLLLALNLSLIFAVLAMSNSVRESTKPKMFMTLAALSFLPLIGLAFQYQLIGQIGGLCLGIGLIALYAEFRRENQFLMKSSAAQMAILLGGLFIWYPEIVPFVLLPIFVSEVASSIRNKNRVMSTVTPVLIVLGTLTMALGPYLLDSLRFVLKQLLGAQIAVSNLSTYLFPYYLVPHGLPSLLGLTPLNIIQDPNRESVLIVISIILLSALFIYAFISFKNLASVGGLFLTMTAAFLILLLGKSGFGTFKLAMYIQPVIAVLLAHGLVDLWKRVIKRRVKYVGGFLSASAVSVFLLLGLSTQQYYAQASTGEKNLGFSQLSGGSSGNLVSSLEKVFKEYEVDMGPVISTTSSIVLAKIEAIKGGGIPLFFTSHDFFTNFYADVDRAPDAEIKFSDVNIFADGGENTIRISNYQFPEVVSRQYFLVSPSERTIFNNQARNSGNKEWRFELKNNLENYLIFTSSEKGEGYFGSNRDSIGLYEPESDPMQPNSFMQALGSRLVAQVVSPSNDAHLIISLSSTLLPQHDRKLPVVALNQATGVKLPIVGRGSARIEVRNFTTEEVKGREYLQFLFLNEPRLFPQTGNRITQLYGKDIPIDTRFISTFGKNISLVTKESFNQKKAPSLIGNVSEALREENLFYSGVYEDGWVAEDSYFILDGRKSRKLLVDGTIPLLGNSRFKTFVSVYLNDRLLETRQVGVGTFNLDLDLGGVQISPNSRDRVTLRFSSTQRLSGTDGRPVSALITQIGFSN